MGRILIIQAAHRACIKKAGVIAALNLVGKMGDAVPIVVKETAAADEPVMGGTHANGIVRAQCEETGVSISGCERIN